MKTLNDLELEQITAAGDFINSAPQPRGTTRPVITTSDAVQTAGDQIEQSTVSFLGN